MPLADGSVLEIVAHRLYYAERRDLGRREGKATRYDRVIEDLIRSMELSEYTVRGSPRRRHTLPS
ncbi:MAG: hypothetical protein ACRD2T_02760 [Thermoanaerobaculia bacterium]